MKKIKVAIGMSGGVDSSVAALLLKEQGYEVIGLFMKNWEELSGACNAAEDYQDVIRVCDSIGIPYYTVNFTKEYWDLVFTHFLEELKKGYTPNPDILCNREIKFKALFQKAMELGADYLATGHYAQIAEGLLLRSADTAKDQTYFLYTLKKSILEKVLFPLGHLKKEDVRALAHQHGLATAAKKDSTGICFIGERNFQKFISQYIPYQKGPFKTLEGKIVGEHEGVAFYTIGQRKGLKIGGPGKAWFVVAKDVPSNTIYIEQGDDHPALYASCLTASELTWVAGQPPSLPFPCHAKIRYRQPDQECLIANILEDTATISFPTPQRAITPRQSIVFYKGSTCLGGALIDCKCEGIPAG